ncbi:hypothetical protein LTR66_014776 [Elasticomyces elasticus]|nr:hypothetical protein LTR66_014776 [Elasticomyces elasticus]
MSSVSHLASVDVDSTVLINGAMASRKISSSTLRRTNANTLRGADTVSHTSTTTPHVVRPRPTTVSRMPEWLKFPLVVALSLGSSTVAYSLIADLTGYQLAAVSRQVDDTARILALVAWKVLELGIAWWAGYDYLDTATLAFLTHAPYFYLLHHFYTLSLPATLLPLLIDVGTLSLPFLLLRGVTPAHDPDSHAPGQPIVNDRNQASTSLTIWGSFFTWLPVYVVTHFEYVKSLESAHNAALVPILVQFLFTVGLAARKFLFQASSGAAMSRADAAEKVFAPDTVSLLETLRYNAGMWRWTKREDVLAKRTAVLTLWTFANTWVRVFGTLDGSDALGAAGWAGVWAVASLATGVAFGWVDSNV